MNKQEVIEFIDQQKMLGFLPLAKSVQELAPKTRRDTNLTNALKRAIPEKDLKTMEVKGWAANRLIFFRATPKNLALVNEVCQEINRKRQAEKKFWTSKKLADALRERHGLPISQDTLNEYARKGKLPFVKNGRNRLFNPKDTGKIKRVILKMQKRRGVKNESKNKTNEGCGYSQRSKPKHEDKRCL